MRHVPEAKTGDCHTSDIGHRQAWIVTRFSRVAMFKMTEGGKQRLGKSNSGEDVEVADFGVGDAVIHGIGMALEIVPGNAGQVLRGKLGRDG